MKGIFIHKKNIDEREIIVTKIFRGGNFLAKYYFITNIGVLVSHLSKEGNYEITDLFLETSPGRLIFSTNFINSITK